MTSTKEHVRAGLLAARRAMPEPDRAAADAATWKALHAFLSTVLPEGGTVAAYRPFGSEPGARLQPELPERLAETFTVLLPVVLGDNDLDWTVWGAAAPAPRSPAAPRPAVALTGPKGAEGRAETSGVESVTRADALIVPALAVAPSGTRLGRGGGSYDRALGRVARGVPVVALLRDGEFGGDVSAEPHDRPVTGVITPGAGYRAVA